jgi:hypothetical protein
VAALLAQGLELACQVRAPFRWSAQALELACRVRASFRWCLAPIEYELKSTGAWVFSGRLHEPDTATVVRVSGG